MSATMVWQGGRLQLDQSDIRRALYMAKMAEGGFSCSMIEGTQYLIKQPGAKGWWEKKQAVEFPWHNDVKPAMERHPAMFGENQSDGCLRCQHGTVQNPQTRWRWKGTGAPPPERLTHLTPEPMPHQHGKAPVLPCDNEGAHTSKIEGVLPRYVYVHSCPPNPQFCNLDAYAKYRKHDQDFGPDLLTDKGP